MLANDVCRCEGRKSTWAGFAHLCDKRYQCARYLERNWSGQIAPHHPYLCDDEGDMYIPAEKPNDH